MSEYNLANAVSSFTTYTSAAQSIWALYTVAGFTAAGFGASLDDQFTGQAALLLAAAYSAFAFAHLHVALGNVSARETIAAEVCARLHTSPALTDYPRSVEAILYVASGRKFTYALHAIIDTCVIGMILAQGFKLI
jgi:hypothetical protein